MLLTRVEQVGFHGDGLDDGVAVRIHALQFQPLVKLFTVLHRIVLDKRARV